MRLQVLNASQAASQTAVWSVRCLPSVSEAKNIPGVLFEDALEVPLQGKRNKDEAFSEQRATPGLLLPGSLLLA